MSEYLRNMVSAYVASMDIPKLGTIVLIKKTGSGCLGAEGKIGIVTDEVADHGLAADRPGFNVATYGMGHIWRINQDAEVKILYRPHD